MHRGRSAEPLVHRTRQLVADADAGEVGIRVGVVNAMRIDDGHRIRKRGRRKMVIGDDCVDARPLEFSDLFSIRDAAIDGDYQVELLLDRAQHERLGQAVTVRAFAHLDLDRVSGQERTQCAVEDGGAGQSVRVEVPVDEDALLALECLLQPIDGTVHVGQQEG